MHRNGKPRRRHSEEFEQEVIAACAQPGASVAAVARSFELNDNLVHPWRRRRGSSMQRTVEAVPGFVALSLPAPTLPEPAAIPPIEGIRIDVKRGPLNISVTWPVVAGERAVPAIEEGYGMARSAAEMEFGSGMLNLMGAFYSAPDE